MNRFGFYYKEILLALKKPAPAIVFGILFAIIIWLMIWITKKIVDKSWEREPEKTDRLIKAKIQLQGERIRLLKMNIRKLTLKNIELRNLIKGIRGIINVENKE